MVVIKLGLRSAFACLLAVVGGAQAVGAERPNIVWLISEDNSVHYLRLFDAHGTETPHIAELAKQGLVFEHAFSNAPVCSVARTTLMTSCLAPRIGTQYHRKEVTVPMPAQVKMFPAYLREAGYYTTNNRKKDYNAVETRGTWDQSSGNASWRNRRSGQPFFHMQSFGTSHESSLHFSQTQYESKKTETDPQSVFVAPYHPDTELFRYTVAKYHDNIRAVDKEIGAVVEQLRTDGLLDDTFVFYFGDHGGVLPRGKGYAYESGLHVPLVVHVPKNFQHLAAWSPGSQVSGFVQFIDFGATALNLAGVELPAGIDGRPFFGEGVSRADVDQRQQALGYADRFDEKYDFVRTLRKGKYEYVRSYQPFNFDGLQNNYRYIMLAYEEWRSLYHAGELDAEQRQFFETRPAEMLFDVEADPHEVHNLANLPEYRDVLLELRGALQAQVKGMPDLSFFPESYLAQQAFEDPVGFGQQRRAEIARLVDLADLSLESFDRAQPALQAALDAEDPLQRYWALIVCSCFGEQASPCVDRARELLEDEERLVRVRAAEFLALVGAEDPVPTLMACLKDCRSGIETNLILNTLVLLRDGATRIEFPFDQTSVHPEAAKAENVRRRISYLTGELRGK